MHNIVRSYMHYADKTEKEEAVMRKTVLPLSRRERWAQVVSQIPIRDKLFFFLEGKIIENRQCSAYSYIMYTIILARPAS